MRKKTFIVIAIILVFTLTSITMAYFKWNSNNNNVEFTINGLDAFIIYNKGTDILAGILDPVSSYDESAVSSEITLYKNTTKSIYGHIYLDISTIGTNLANEKSLKWVITSNNKILNQGNFVGNKTGDSISLKLNIPLSQNEQTFKIYIWLDKNNDINDEIEGETLSTIVRAEASEMAYEIESNTPSLPESMIPVMYSNNKWVKADVTNENNNWYDYENKQWANAVLVTNTNRDTYKQANVGTEISESDILAYYVWIPRYKYRVWNINKQIGVDSYDAYNKGIDIVFENGNESSGTITCDDYDFSVTDGSLSETCNGNNGEYYTHPAFTFGDDELKGFWFGKYELSNENSTTSDGGGSSLTYTPRIVPSVYSWKRNSVDAYQYVIQAMQKENNIYGLTTDKTKADSHLTTNMEWGAVAYLTNSKYGYCTDGKCSEVGLNSCSALKTGCGPQELGNNSTEGSTCNYYNTELGLTSSTTGNIYGIYDMNGGAYEYVMGNTSLTEGVYEYNKKEGTNNYTYSEDTSKYLTTYAYGTTNSDQTAYNRGRLGDATSEFVTSSGYTWYDDWGYFTYSSRPWFLRGDYVSDTTGAGVFAFDFFTGASGWSGVGARASLVLY